MVTDAIDSAPIQPLISRLLIIMRIVAVAVVILGACFMQEVSGSVFLHKAAPKDTDAALKEQMKSAIKQHLVVDTKETDKKENVKVVDKKEVKKEEKKDTKAEKKELKKEEKKEVKAEKKEEKKEVKAEKKEEKKEQKVDKKETDKKEHVKVVDKK